MVIGLQVRWHPLVQAPTAWRRRHRPAYAVIRPAGIIRLPRLTPFRHLIPRSRSVCVEEPPCRCLALTRHRPLANTDAINLIELETARSGHLGLIDGTLAADSSSRGPLEQLLNVKQQRSLVLLWMQAPFFKRRLLPLGWEERVDAFPLTVQALQSHGRGNPHSAQEDRVRATGEGDDDVSDVATHGMPNAATNSTWVSWCISHADPRDRDAREARNR